MSTEEIPPLPTREQELKYMKFLERSINTDPWLTLRPSKYMASPWRLYWKKQIEMKKEYRKTFFKNFITCASLAYPLVIYLAYKKQYTSSGVPITKVLPSDMFNPRTKIIQTKNRYTRRTFYYHLLKFGVLFGFIGALLTTDHKYLNQGFNARPDLGQFRAMTENIPENEKRVFEFYDGKSYPDIENPTFLKRAKAYFFPSVDYNPRYESFYNFNRDYFPDLDASSYYSN